LESYSENTKEIIAANLTALRKASKMTQQELASKLNYSDKAISRWEHAETLPDIDTLCKICTIYGVRFEYLLQKEQPKKNNPYIEKRDTANRVLITIIAAFSVWIAAFALFFGLNMATQINVWMIFIWAIPSTNVVLLVCNAFFFRSKTYKYIVSSFLMWSLLLACYLQLIAYNMWMLFIVGVPVQAVIMLSAFLKPSTAQRKRKD
jgi:transcriptional regulator with XRE-family HTH domain